MILVSLTWLATTRMHIEGEDDSATEVFEPQDNMPLIGLSG